MRRLKAGDVLSYSAGSSQFGPDGYRHLRGGSNLLEGLARRWPDLASLFANDPPMMINAYPAALGQFEFGILVDTYLSTKTAGRAMQLAARHGLPAILMSQPLIAAEVLFSYYKTPGVQFPDVLVIVVGGYVMPRSLEHAVLDVVRKHTARVVVLHAYGAAEVDAACLWARERAEDGRLIYFSRGPDVEVVSRNGTLWLGRPETEIDKETSLMDTGDRISSVGEGLVLEPRSDRYHPEVERCLESWSAIDWQRRTGYLDRAKDWRFQLRNGVAPADETELGFFEFGSQYGFSWLNKPSWS